MSRMTTFGSSGIDFTNHRLNGAATYFNDPDPSLLPYGHFEAVSTGGDGGQNAYRFVPNDNSRITDQGYVRGPGGNYVQLQPDGNYNFSDPNAIINDPEFGSLTRVENIKQPHDMWSTWLPVAVASLLGGPVAYAAAGAGAAGGGLLGDAGAAGAADTAPMGAFDQFGSTGLGDVFAGAGGGAGAGGAGVGAGVGADTAPMGAFDQFGSSGMGDVFGSGAPVTDLSVGAGGAPVTDLSVHAGLGDTLNNLIPGGLLNGGGLSNLLRIAGLGTSLSGLLSHPNNTNNTNNNNSNNNNTSNKGGGGQGLNITRGQYTPNPYTQQQLQNFSFAQPRGR